ncbi:cilia- and flagella-associated protein 157-like isoform X1 [Scomber scombrus]|uniref:Cilia- and flagella-associated protein 157-like isoform X1 n=1 Tax=Scomber scombrus TaxID=13677 RepID=A0AAV1Q6G0_SCOSC
MEENQNPDSPSATTDKQSRTTTRAAWRRTRTRTHPLLPPINRAEIPAFLLAKYIAADLGLVPCPRWNRRPKASRTDAAQSCSSNQQPLNRKLCSQKTSSSVDQSEASTSADG